MSRRDWVLSIAAVLALAVLLAFLCYWLAVFGLKTMQVGQDTTEYVASLRGDPDASPRRWRDTPRRSGGHVMAIGLFALIGSFICGIASVLIPLVTTRYLISHVRSARN